MHGSMHGGSTWTAPTASDDARCLCGQHPGSGILLVATILPVATAAIYTAQQLRSVPPTPLRTCARPTTCMALHAPCINRAGPRRRRCGLPPCGPAAQLAPLALAWCSPTTTQSVSLCRTCTDVGRRDRASCLPCTRIGSYIYIYGAPQR